MKRWLAGLLVGLGLVLATGSWASASAAVVSPQDLPVLLVPDVSGPGDGNDELSLAVDLPAGASARPLPVDQVSDAAAPEAAPSAGPRLPPARASPLAST